MQVTFKPHAPSKGKEERGIENPNREGRDLRRTPCPIIGCFSDYSVHRENKMLLRKNITFAAKQSRLWVGEFLGHLPRNKNLWCYILAACIGFLKAWTIEIIYKSEKTAIWFLYCQNTSELTTSEVITVEIRVKEAVPLVVPLELCCVRHWLPGVFFK